MCNSVSELKDLLETITNGSTLTTTKWYAGNSRGPHGFGSPQDEATASLKIVTADKIIRGGLRISQNNYGGSPQRKVVTIESVRGILTTMFAVAVTDTSREAALLFGKLVETLATKCFQVEEVRINLDGGDAEVRLSFTNGYTHVSMHIKDCRPVANVVSLDLGDTDYVMTRDFATALVGGAAEFRSGGNMSVRKEDGTFGRICTISSYRDTNPVDTVNVVTAEQLEAVMANGDATDQMRLVQRVVQKQLVQAHGDLVLGSIRMNAYRGDSKQTIALEYQGNGRVITVELMAP